MIKNFLDWFSIYELDFNIHDTEYSINNIEDIIQYSFISKNDYSYSVYFKLTKEDNEHLSNGKYLKDYCDLNNIPTIFFSLTERGFGNNFDDLTSNKEFLEVMGKVVFLIKEFIQKNDYNVYTIGEVGSKKYKFYNNYRKYFSDYMILTGKSKNYLDKNNNKMNAYFMIKEKYENVDKLRLDENLYLKF
jgi:hypothetical protein